MSQVEPRKRGEYAKFSQVEKTRIAKYASEHGVSKAIRHFKESNLKEHCEGLEEVVRTRSKEAA